MVLGMGMMGMGLGQLLISVWQIEGDRRQGTLKERKGNVVLQRRRHRGTVGLLGGEHLEVLLVRGDRVWLMEVTKAGGGGLGVGGIGDLVKLMMIRKLMTLIVLVMD